MVFEQTYAEGLTAHLRDFLTDEEVIKEYRVREQDFTRRRKLGFPAVVGLVLQGGNQPLQARVNAFFKALGEPENAATASAFYQARQKIQASFFQDITREVVTYFYRQDAQIGLQKSWQGHRILATDASYLNLPDTDETHQVYSAQSNQYSKKTCIQALTSCLYDVLNEIPINVSLGPIQAEKNFIFRDHVRFWQPNDVVIYDRLYVDYSVISFHILCGIFFVARCPLSSSFKAITDFVQSDHTDTCVTLQVTSSQKEFVETHDLPQRVTVRLVKISLPDGTTEVLMTSLLDPTRYPPAALAWLYTQRWGVETYFDRLKNLLDVERFSSSKLWAILQDFYAVIFLTCLESVLCKAVDASLATVSRQKGLKYVYKVNKNISYHALTLFLVELLQKHHKPIPLVLQLLSHMFRQRPIPIRPNRRYQRKKQSPRRQVRYLRYEKRIWA